MFLWGESLLAIVPEGLFGLLVDCLREKQDSIWVCNPFDRGLS
jgi:hypothetical protein